MLVKYLQNNKGSFKTSHKKCLVGTYISDSVHAINIYDETLAIKVFVQRL